MGLAFDDDAFHSTVSMETMMQHGISHNPDSHCQKRLDACISCEFDLKKHSEQNMAGFNI